MRNYDAEIRVSTKVETSQMQKLQIQIDKAVDKVNTLTKKYDDLKNQKIPTQEYANLENKLNHAKYALENLLDEQKRLSDKGIGKGLDVEITHVYKAVQQLKNELAQAVEIGDQNYYFEIEDALNKVKAHLQELMSKEPRPLGDLIYYDNIGIKVKNIKEEIAPIKAEMQKLVDTGKAFTIGADRNEINNAAKDLAQAKAELNMLATKQEELGGKTAKISDGLKKIGSVSRSAFGVISKGAGKSSNAFSLMRNSAGRAFSAVSGGARNSSGLLSAFSSCLKGLAASAFIFNLISKGFNSMVSSMRTGFANLMGYSNGFANSIQSVKNSLSTLGNQIAAAFAPIVQAVIPWLNQLISLLSVAMSYVAQFIAALTGKSSYIRAKKVQDSYGASLGGTVKKEEDVADSANDMSDALDDTADSAKKARGALAAFDDLDVLEKQDKESDKAADKIKDLDDAIKDLGNSGAGGGGIGDLFEEVPIENSVLDAVEKLEEILAQLFAPLKEAWEREGEFVMKAWKYALEEIWKLIKDIGRDFLTVWNQEETIQMLADLLHILGDVGLIIGNIAHALDEAWNKNQTGLHILENIRDIFAVIIHNIREAADYTVLWSETLDFSPLLESIEHLTAALVPFADFVSGTLMDFYTQFLLPLASWTISENGIPRLINILGDFMDAVNWEALREALKNLYSALEPYAEAIGEGLIDFIEEIKNLGVDILNALPEPIQKLADALASGDPEKVQRWTTTLLEFIVAIEGLKLVFKGFEVVQSGLALFGVGGAASTVATTATEAAGGISLLSSALSGLVAVGTGLGIVEMLKEPIFDLAEAAGVSSDKADYMRERYRGLGGDLNLVKDPVSVLTNGFQGLGWEMSNAMGASGALETAMNNITEGMIYTDDKLTRMQKNFSLTSDDMEMLRQAMLDANPELVNLADSFGLFDASVETLQMVHEGMKLVEDGTITAAEAFDEFSKPMWGMNDSALAFFQTLSESGMTIDEYKASLENASEATQQFSNDMQEAGENISTGITEGFENADVETPTRGFFAKVVECLRSVFDMHSPAKNMEPFGENIFLGIVEGFRAAFAYFTEVLTEWWENYVVPWFSAEKWAELGENVKMSLFETWTAIYETIVEKWTEIQEWFAEYWILFTESLIETWENIVLFFTETWEQIQLLFNNFIEFLATVFIVTWQTIWETAKNLYQIFRDVLTTITNVVKEMLSLFLKTVKLLVEGDWKGAWENAKNIFETFKGKVSSVIDVIRGIIQSFFDWLMGIVSEAISAIESIGSAVKGIFGGGGGAGSGGGRSAAPAMASYSARDFAAFTNDLPHLASGSVLRGGNPFMAILNEQPRGQTNVEAPLDTIKQAVREELSGMEFGGNASLTVPLYLDGEEFARLFLDDILSEMGRQGYDVDILGVT